MRILFLILSLTTLALAGEIPPLTDARVQIPYPELRALLEAAAPPPPAESPVASALLSARYDLQLGAEATTGQATYEVQTFRDGPHVVPLAGGELMIASIEPADAIVVLQDGHYAATMNGKQRKTITLNFSLPAGKAEDTRTFESAIIPAVSASVTVRGILEGQEVTVENGLRDPSPQHPALWHLGPTRQLRVALRDQPKPLPPPVTMPAVIPEVQSRMRVVRDGAFSNAMTWRIRHQTPLVWTLALPESLQLVSARVNGQPASPSRRDPDTLEFRLPEPPETGETTVEISYTGRGPAFDPVRGQLALTLPSTPLLIENLRWAVAMPAAYETMAAQGNVDFLPGENAQEILLGKELCQGESPTVQLFYQKPSTTQKSSK